MSIKAATAFASVILAVPGIALAEFDYNFVEGSFVDVEIDDTSVDGDGIRLEASFEIGGTFFGHVEYEDYDFDFNIDGNMTEFGGGYFHGLSDDLDFIATGQYDEVEIEGYDDDGLGIGGGIRARVADSLEIDAMLNYVDFDNIGNDTFADLRARYYFNDQFAVTLKLELGSDVFDTMGIGVRYSFSPIGSASQ
jgi:hypothetical protein